MSKPRPLQDLAALLRRAGDEDRSAFDALYECTAAKLFGVICRICDNRELAKEALQESYLTIWRNAKLYDVEIASPIAWMARIARNQAIDARRRRSEQISARSEPSDENVMSLEPDPEAALRQSEALRRLTMCLDALPADRRDMVLLAYYNGWSREELSDRFMQPVNTVKTILRRSLALLRECLDGKN